MKKWMVSPPLSLVLFVVWLLLNQALDMATLLMALVLALVVPLLTRGLRPTSARMRRPVRLLRLLVVVGRDVALSALEVARLLLTRPRAAITPSFVTVPLQVRDANALALLAIIICLTPGTAWAELSLDRHWLRIHVFDLPDEAAFIAQIKTRYERPLMEIFES